MAKKPAKPTGKAKALSLHIGLNGVSGAAYGGWDGPLSASESMSTKWPRSRAARA